VTDCDMEQVLRQCCADAAGCGDEIADRLVAIATQLRDGDVQAGSAGLTAIAPDLRGLATLLNAMADAPWIEREWLDHDGLNPRQQLDRLGIWLGSLVSAQTTGDWVTASDILEYDLVPALRRWEQLLVCVAK
jgi:hypothetical protein